MVIDSCNGINTLYTERYTRSAFLYRYSSDSDDREITGLRPSSITAMSTVFSSVFCHLTQLICFNRLT
jgi:hypothetical protein